MRIYKIHENVTKNIYKVLSKNKHRNLIKSLNKNPRKSIVALMGNNSNIEKLLSQQKNKQINVINALIQSIIQSNYDVKKVLKPIHSNKQIILELTDLESANKVAVTLSFWALLITNISQSNNLDDACRAAIADLHNKINAVIEAGERLRNCNKGLSTGSNSSSDLPIFLGVGGSSPFNINNNGGGECIRAQINFDAVLHELEVAIFNLPRACG